MSPHHDRRTRERFLGTVEREGKGDISEFDL